MPKLARKPAHVGGRHGLGVRHTRFAVVIAVDMEMQGIADRWKVLWIIARYNCREREGLGCRVLLVLVTHPAPSVRTELHLETPELHYLPRDSMRRESVRSRRSPATSAVTARRSGRIEAETSTKVPVAANAGMHRPDYLGDPLGFQWLPGGTDLLS